MGMYEVLVFVFVISGFCILFPMVIYPLSVIFLGKIFSNKQNIRDYKYEPSVAIMVVAHDEEKVIEDKLNNLLRLDYPKEKLSVYVASDNSTDSTDRIVENFIKRHKEVAIKLHRTKEHKGKTNAQNETQKLIHSEILVMTDANAMLEVSSIREIVAMFADENVAYVTGCLKYINSSSSSTANTEARYWSLDTLVRDVEGRIQSVTAGNGALYACRNDDYIVFNPIQCHDSAMPLAYVRKGKRAVNCMNAVAYEKAGENNNDEYKRKVRMNRIILDSFANMVSVCNMFKYRWFTYFYFGHRFLRYTLWINHILLIITSIILVQYFWTWSIVLVLHFVFFVLCAIQLLFKTKNKIMIFMMYYFITIIAQIHAACKQMMGKSRPVWEKAASTR